MGVFSEDYNGSEFCKGALMGMHGINALELIGTTLANTRKESKTLQDGSPVTDEATRVDQGRGFGRFLWRDRGNVHEELIPQIEDVY